MSRSGYSEDCEYLDLWRSNVERTIGGKNGQAFLLELVQSLDAMPEKRLIRDSLKTGGEVCALGSVGLKRGLEMKGLDPEDPQMVGRAFGISSMLAQEIVYKNDEHNRNETPEQRWARIRSWAQDNLKASAIA